MSDTNIKPVTESLANIYQLDFSSARDRFQFGKLHGFRSKIVHGGRMFAIHSLLSAYIEAIYVDLLIAILNLPHQRRAEQVLNHPQFDLGKFINPN